MRILKRIIKYALKHWPLLLTSLLLVLVTSALDLIWPQFQRWVIDTCLEKKQYHLLGGFALGLSGLFLVKGAIVFLREYVSHEVAVLSCYDIRNQLFNHIQRLSFAYHDTMETGQLISRSTADVDAISTFIAVGITHFLANALVFVCVLVTCFIMNWQLALLSVMLIPFIGIAVFKYSNKVGPMYTDVQNQVGKMTSRIQQNVMGIRVVKAFSREDHETAKFDELTLGLYDKSMAVTKVTSVYGPLMDFIGAAGLAIILWFGGLQVVQGKLTIGGLVTFNTYLMMLLGPVRIAAWLVSIVQSSVAAGERIFEVLDIRQESHLRDGTRELHECEGAVEFRNVCFEYPDGTHALHGLSFAVEPGAVIGIMGPTGSGKTSIINLIPRFYDAQAGQVLVDGVDVREYRIASLRRHVGLVSQEHFLFGDTIRENIAYGRPLATMDEIIQAAIIADIHEFIVSLPDGYETKLGERGVNLSGGQKQRMSIARAVLKDPTILIMDDSTSSVDTETEANIQSALKAVTQSRTTFIIAQRVSSVMGADKIVMLDNGRIVEMGNHDELMALGGKYAERYAMQFGSKEEK